MTKTLLIDLDDTLLRHERNSFLPAYLQALGKRLSAFVDPDRMIKTLMSATAKMIQNTCPNLTLMDVFDQSFYPTLGVKKSDLIKPIDIFYDEDFPHLKSTTSIIPSAIELVKKAFEQGYQIGIATNPLLPRTAIVQRLAWAGLSPEEYPFTLIPSYSTFHFSKPNPAYFAEFLALMGWPDGSVVMVGDEEELDINPARKIGLPVFWIPADPQATWNGSGELPPYGTHRDLMNWIALSDGNMLPTECVTPEALRAILSSTPAALQTFANDIPLDHWDARPAPGEWALTEILCHLRDSENEVNLPRLEKLVLQDNPFLPASDTDAWAEERQYLHQDGKHALEAFVSKRIEMLALLESMDEKDWDRPARHAIFGPIQLKELVRFVAKHDQLHIRQVYNLMVPVPS